jgi:glycosyltransferase involved in cell wall biosynthesis
VQSVLNAPPVQAEETDAVDRSAWGNVDHALLFVGRLESQKGLDRLLTSLASPELATKSFRLLVIGDGSAMSALVSQAGALGLGDRVVFAGAGPARSAMRAADIVICPSRNEGMPLVPMESILAGTALVASPIAPHRELLDALPSSLLPTSDADWPARLSALLSDREGLRRLVEQQARLRGRFSLARVVAQYDAIYARMASAHACRGAARSAPFVLRQLKRCAHTARRKLPSTRSATP